MKEPRKHTGFSTANVRVTYGSSKIDSQACPGAPYGSPALRGTPRRVSWPQAGSWRRRRARPRTAERDGREDGEHAEVEREVAQRHRVLERVAVLLEVVGRPRPRPDQLAERAAPQSTSPRERLSSRGTAARCGRCSSMSFASQRPPGGPEA